jgi:rhodanese-related sulfurtransferase
MTDHQAKTALFDALAEVAKALASGRRAQLVDVLAQGERSVEELATEIDQTLANTSQHLHRLLIHYSRASPAVDRLWRTMRETAERHVAGLELLAEAYVGDRTSLDTMTRDELRARLRKGDVVVLDVRPRAEYAAGHIPGAVSVPVDDLRERLKEIDGGTDVVAYCRGPYCVYADDAVRLLVGRGRIASRLEDGFPEWAAAGLPVDREE